MLLAVGLDAQIAASFEEACRHHDEACLAPSAADADDVSALQARSDARVHKQMTLKQTSGMGEMAEIPQVVADAYSHISSDGGVLLKFLGPPKDVRGSFSGANFSGNFTPPLNDCVVNGNNCGGWNYYKAGLVPILYNTPYQSHSVGLIVHGVPEVWDEVKYLHIVDGITLGRTGPSTVMAGEAQFYPTCPNGVDPSKLDVLCAAKPVVQKYQVTCQKDETKGPDYYYYEFPIGENGEGWFEQFMQESSDGLRSVSRSFTNMRQCGFDLKSKDLFVSVLKQFYSETTKLKSPSDGPIPEWARNNLEQGDDDKRFYLENEVNTQTPYEQLKALITPHLSGIFVQTLPCIHQYSGIFSADGCEKTYPGGEDKNIAQAKYVGCRAGAEVTKWKYGSKASSTLYVPVFGTSFMTPYAPNKEKWDSFVDSKTAPKDYMQELDCGKILAAGDPGL